MIQVFLFFALLIAALAVTFALQNTAIVTVSFLLWGFTGSLALVLFVALTTGAIVGWLVTMPSVLRARISDLVARCAHLDGQLSINSLVNFAFGHSDSTSGIRISDAALRRCPAPSISKIFTANTLSVIHAVPERKPAAASVLSLRRCHERT